MARWDLHLGPCRFWVRRLWRGGRGFQLFVDFASALPGRRKFRGLGEGFAETGGGVGGFAGRGGQVGGGAWSGGVWGRGPGFPGGG